MIKTLKTQISHLQNEAQSAENDLKDKVRQADKNQQIEANKMRLWKKVNDLDNMRNRQQRLSEKRLGKFEYDDLLEEVSKIKKES